jgi:hypothetical protein
MGEDPCPFVALALLVGEAVEGRAGDLLLKLLSGLFDLG